MKQIYRVSVTDGDDPQLTVEQWKEQRYDAAGNTQGPAYYGYSDNEEVDGTFETVLELALGAASDADTVAYLLDQMGAHNNG
jgi:hypothetical protein